MESFMLRVPSAWNASCTEGPCIRKEELLCIRIEMYYYLRMEKDYQWLAYPHKLTVELGSYVDGEAHGWAQ